MRTSEHQKCWTCARANGSFGGCKWCRDLIPVDGWTAEAVSISKPGYFDRDGFYIIDCPEFIEDSYPVSGATFCWLRDAPRDKSSFDEENARELVYAAIKQAIDEYLASTSNAFKAQIINELRDMDCYGVSDSDVIINELLKKERRRMRDY